MDPDKIPLMHMVSKPWRAKLDVPDLYMQSEVLPKIRNVWHRLHPSEMPGDVTPVTSPWPLAASLVYSEHASIDPGSGEVPPQGS